MIKSKYHNLYDNIKDISENCGWGNYYKKLGLGYNTQTGKFIGGLCFGLAFMWGQAVLAEDQETYFKRLDFLTDEYPRWDSLSCRINEIVGYARRAAILGKPLRPEKNNINLNTCFAIHHTDYNLAQSIRAFMDGLLLYQKPSQSSFCREYPAQDVDVSKYVANDEIVNGNDPLKCIARWPFCGTETNFIYFLYSIFKNLNLADIPFFMGLVTVKHSIAITMCKGKLYIYDANEMCQGRYCWSIDVGTPGNYAALADRIFNNSFFIDRGYSSFRTPDLYILIASI